MNSVSPMPRFASTKVQPPRDGADTPPELKRVGSCWDQNSRNWTQVIRSGKDVFRTGFLDQAFNRFLGPVKNLDVLDAGCGEGSLCRQMASEGARVTGVDLSRKLIHEAAAHPENGKLNVRYQVGSFTDLDGIASESFDRVVSSMALMDSPDLNGSLRSFSRVLRPGGELIFSIKHPFMTLPNVSCKADAASPKVNLSFEGSYFDSDSFEKTVDFDLGQGSSSAIRTIHYPKTMSGYINALKEAGFTTIVVEEPRPSEDLCRDNPQMLRYRKLPSVLMVRACKAKPASVAEIASALGARMGQWNREYLLPVAEGLLQCGLAIKKRIWTWLETFCQSFLPAEHKAAGN